eukprot:848384-Prymnesium_polylepis.1
MGAVGREGAARAHEVQRRVKLVVVRARQLAEEADGEAAPATEDLVHHGDDVVALDDAALV